MKNSILLVIILFNAFSALPQDVSVKWGKDYKIPKRSYIKKIVAEDGNGFYLIRGKGETRLNNGEIILERYSKDNFTLQYANSLPLSKVNGESVKFEQLYYLDQKLVLFTSYFDKTKGTNSVYAQYLDENGKSNSDLMLISTINAYQKKNTGKFEIVLSKDFSKILVCSNQPYEKYINEKISYKVLDADLNEIWVKDLEMPYKDKEFNISNHVLDNSGNVHMLAKITKKEERTDKGQANYYYTILSYFYSNNIIKEYEISLNYKSVSDIAFQVSTGGDHLVAAGFYSNTTKGQSVSNTNFGFSHVAYQEPKSLIAGTFYLKIDLTTQKVTARGMKDFERSFLSEFMSPKNIDKGKELYSYLIDHFILKEDGGAILAGEQYYSTMVCNYDPRTGIRNCNYHYYYNDIILVNINPDGSVAWTKKIPKKQHSINDRGFYSSYILGYNNSGIFIVFNDHPKNFIPDSEKRMKYMNNPKRAIVALVAVNQDGSTKKTPLFSARDQKIIVRPRVFSQLDSSGAIIYGQKKRIYKIGKMSFPPAKSEHAPAKQTGHLENNISGSGN